MKRDKVLRVTLWLIAAGSSGPEAEGFAGDLLELSTNGRSRWWCLGQALRRAMSICEHRLRSLLIPLWFSVGIVFLYPLWQRLYAPVIAPLLTRYRGSLQWPGSAVLEIIAGLLPAVLFVWVGVFMYALVRRQSLNITLSAVLLSLNVGACLLFIAMMMRLHVMQNDLHLLSRANFYYPVVHTRFSILLLLSMFGAVAILPRERRPAQRRKYVVRLISRCGLLHVARSLGLVAMLVPRLSAQVVQLQATPRLMAADGKPLEFDVVSVKPNHTGAVEMRIGSAPMSDDLTITNMPPENIIQWAFGTFLSDQILGLPDWAKHERYDVQAKVSDADVAAYRKVIDPIQRTPMLQKILVDRFGMKFHHETRELPVYALTIGKSGTRITEIQPALGPNGMRDGGRRQRAPGRYTSLGQPMKPFVDALTMELKTPVVDRTGLTGFYNYTLHWAPETETPSADDAPQIFTAVQEQLGLKLERTKVPMQVLVIDHLERPSTN